MRTVFASSGTDLCKDGGARTAPEVDVTDSSPPATVSPEEIEAGKTMATIAWVGMFTGLPLFIIPLAQRDNAFAFFHAKHAALVYIIAMIIAVVVMVISVITCGMGTPLMVLLFLTLVPTIDGLIKAINGKMEDPLITGGFTEQLFGGLKLDAKPAAPTPAAPAAPPAPATPAAPEPPAADDDEPPASA
jgi:uncharacterized membrane protein